tara:strand:- start:1190 stop:3325 length:2136 start_codon:yes stop_codon:yes gene_type:complete
MAVKQEIKSQLAKLLATEDFVVEHKHVETAQFDVDTRVLTLPIWEKASNDVYDMLVGHEVGHALYTPNDWSFEGRIPLSFVNIVEDARIEKLIKRRYPGLSKTFFHAYKELHEQDFFNVLDINVDEMNIADRINLYFKVGNFLDIYFDDCEKDIINKINLCETFEDTLEVAELLYNYCKGELKRKKEEQEEEREGTDPADLETPSYSFETKETDKEEKLEDEESKTETQTQSVENKPSRIDEQKEEEPEVKTVQALEESLKDLVDQGSAENVYVERPKLNLDRVIISNEEIHERCDEQWVDDIDMPAFTVKDEDIYYGYRHRSVISEVDKKFNEFKKSAQKEVNYLVKEFECRKAADNYARTSTNRTGILDTKKLHTYRFNEDIFKKVGIVPDGKNHGLVFILDWSGSMNHVMLDTIKQLYNLIWFCKKVQIPFEVYAFTGDYPKDGEQLSYEPKAGLFEVSGFFSLLNLFTHKTNGKTLEHQMKNIFRLAYNFNHYTCYQTPLGLNLSGTPLNESLLALHSLLPQFKKQNGIDKVQCVILTDGEAGHLSYHRIVHRQWEDEPYLGTRGVHGDCFLRDRKIGTTYKMPYEYYGFSEMLLRNLRDNFPNINFIGIRVLESRDAGSFIRRYCGWSNDQFEKINKVWKKNKSFSIDNSGYHKYFGLSSTHLSNNDEFEVEEDATKAQIKRAFVKSLKTKKMNKKVLSEFVELIA